MAGMPFGGQSSFDARQNHIFQLLKVQISAILDNSPCMGTSDTIEHGVPKAVAELMIEQIIQEFAAGWKSLPEELIRANIENKVEEWKHYASEVIALPSSSVPLTYTYLVLQADFTSDFQARKISKTTECVRLTRIQGKDQEKRVYT
jgi:hypothetical protein